MLDPHDLRQRQRFAYIHNPPFPGFRQIHPLPQPRPWRRVLTQSAGLVALLLVMAAIFSI